MKDDTKEKNISDEKEFMKSKEVNKEETFKSENAVQVKKAGIAKKKIDIKSFVKAIRKRTFIVIAVLIIVFFITRPDMIPFMPFRVKAQIVNALSSLFGDVAQVTAIITLNWITLFQLVIMVLFLLVIKDLIRIILVMIKPKSNRKKTLVDMFLSSSQYFFMIVGIIWALKILGISPGTIFAGISIVALVVGFSAESLIADVVTGLFLLFDNPYDVGDIIEVGEFRGTVSKIGIRTTCIKDAGNNIKFINNSDMRNIINRSSVISKAVSDITIPANQDISTVEACICGILKDLKSRNSKIIIHDPEYLGIQSLSKDGTVIRIAADVNEQDIFIAQRILNREVKIGLQKEGIWG